MKKIVCILSILALLCSALGMVSLASATGQLTVTSVSGNPGETVSVDIAIADNPGLVTLSVTVAFDPSVLELTGVTDTKLLGGNPPLNTTYTSPYTIAWVDYTTTTDNTQNGVIAQLTFRIKDTAESGTSEVVVSFNNSYKVDGVTKNQLAGGSGLITIGSTDPGATNLLQNISTAYKEDFDTFMIENPDSMIWDDTYVYGNSTSPWFSSDYFPKTLSDNDKTTKSYANDYGYAYVYDGEGGADGAAARRVGYWFDLGDTYRLSDVNLYVNTLNYCVYDFSVYGTATFTANSAGTASARAAEVDAMICESNLLGHFKTTTQGLSSALSLTDCKDVRYVLIVFNKLGSDPGNSNAANAGAYGESHLPGASSLNHGGICVTEIEIFGAKPKNLLQNLSTSYKEDFDTFMIENPDSMIWDDTYVYGNSTSPWFSSDYFPKTLSDNDKTTKSYANDYGYAYVYDGEGGADGAAARRVGYWFDLGDTYRLRDVNLYVNTLNYCVYDFSVYGTDTFTANSAGTASARAAEVDTMICESNLLGHFKTTEQSLSSALSLSSSKAVRYVLIVFNKLGSDPGNSNAANAGAYGESHLPGASSLNHGGICVTEMEIFGTKVSVAPLKPPTTLGATINKNATDDIRFFAALPSDLPHDRYTLTEYGMLVMPNQYLPGGVNEKEGAALVYGNAYAATASYAVSEDLALTPAMQFTADLVGSSQGVYPSVNFAVRSYVIYEDETGAQTIVYGNTLVRSVWQVARTIACALLSAKEAGTLDTTLTYTDTVTAEFTAAEAESVTSNTDVTFADLYEFICLNYSAVALLVEQS